MSATRRLIFTVEQRYELPVDDAKVELAFGEQYDDEKLRRVLDENITNGEITVRNTLEMLADEEEMESYLGEMGLDIEVEHRCPRHPDRWAYSSVNPEREPYCGKCLLEDHSGTSS